MKVIELEGVLTLDADQFEETLKDTEASIEEVTKSTNTLADAAKLAMTSLIAGVAIELTKNIGNIITASVKAADKLQDEEEMFARAFGDISDDASAVFQTIGEDTNIVARRLKTVGTKAFSQFKGAGMDVNEALESMDDYLRLVADGAAYYGMTLEDVDTRMRSFIRGNTEAGDAIGLYASESQRNEKALELYNMKWKELNELQRQNTMLQIAKTIYEQGNALGAAAENATDYENLLANLESTRSSILAKIGAPLLAAITPIMESFNDFLTENPDDVAGFAETISEVFGGLLEVLKSVGAWIVDNKDLILGFLDLMKDFFLPSQAQTKSELSFESLLGYTEDEYKKLTDFITYANKLNLEGEGSWEALDLMYEAIEGNERLFNLYKAYSEWRSSNETLFSGLKQGEFPYLPTDIYISKESETLVQEQLDRLDLSVTANLTINTSVMNRVASNVLGRLKSAASSVLGYTPDGSHDTGLPYVPYDGYMAELHQGERVLTELQNAQYSTQEKEPDNETDVYAAELVAAFREAISGMTVQMDKQTVGSIVSPVVFREMGRQLGSKRFAT